MVSTKLVNCCCSIFAVAETFQNPWIPSMLALHLLNPLHFFAITTKRLRQSVVVLLPRPGQVVRLRLHKSCEASRLDPLPVSRIHFVQIGKNCMCKLVDQVLAKLFGEFIPPVRWCRSWALPRTLGRRKAKHLVGFLNWINVRALHHIRKGLWCSGVAHSAACKRIWPLRLGKLMKKLKNG